ncbi:MAG: PrgI family protein [Saccharofermentans sp.]|nr:PrgI family protein [Saccharofermentans sp.]
MKPVEVRVPTDIRKIKADWFRGLTLRQLIASILIMAAFLGFYILGNVVFDIPEILRLLITMIIATPIGIIGFLPYKGLNAEEYIPMILRNMLLPKEFCKHDMPPEEVIAKVRESQIVKIQEESEDA